VYLKQAFGMKSVSEWAIQLFLCCREVHVLITVLLLRIEIQVDCAKKHQQHKYMARHVDLRPGQAYLCKLLTCFSTHRSSAWNVQPFPLKLFRLTLAQGWLLHKLFSNVVSNTWLFAYHVTAT